MSDTPDDDPPLVEVIQVPSLSEAERLASGMREVGIPAIVDPEALQSLQDRGYRDVHGYFPVMVPRHYGESAEDYLRGTVHADQGDAELETILASFDEADVEPGPPTGRRLVRMAVLMAIVALVAILALSGLI